MEHHLGNIVDDLLKQRGITKKFFADKMNYTPQHINNLLSKEHWYTAQIKKASEVLGFNLYSYFIKSADLTNITQLEDNALKEEINKLNVRIKKLEEDLQKVILENKILNERLTDKNTIIELLKSKH